VQGVFFVVKDCVYVGIVRFSRHIVVKGILWVF
jgi:hypothetical protein